MPQCLTIAAAQPSTQPTRQSTLDLLSRTATRASSAGADILLLPEAFIGGYPRGCNFGALVGGRDDVGREQFLRYWQETADLGDTPRGEDGWTGKEWAAERAEKGLGKGDGTREKLEQISRDTGVFLVVGVVERAGGSLYCAALYVCPTRGCIGKRRKVMPTGTERLIWAQGNPKTLRAVVAEIKGVKVTLAAAICWENYMPLLRYSLYSQNVNLWLAPTADARDTWLSLMRMVAMEGRCFVMSACMCTEKKEIPEWIREPRELQKEEQRETEKAGVTGEDAAAVYGTLVNGDTSSNSRRRASVVTRTQGNHEITWPSTTNTSGRRRSSVSIAAGSHELRLPAAPTVTSNTTTTVESNHVTKPVTGSDAGPKTTAVSEYACRGGSCLIGPHGNVIAGPLWEDSDGLLVAEVDFDECIRARLDFDAAGSYSRRDAFELTVKGLDMNPPA